MKTVITSIIIFSMIISSYAQIVSIPDTNFKNALIAEGVDTNGDGLISISEAEAITKLNIDGPHDYDWNYGYGYGCDGNSGITDLTGIEAFANLDSLRCMCGNIESLDLSGNPKLTYLNCSYNRISSLDVSNNPLLVYLVAGSNQLAEIDVSNNPALERLTVPENLLTRLDVSNNPQLDDLWCVENQLTTLNTNNCNLLTSILCDYNQLTGLDLSTNTALERLRAYHNQLTWLNVSGNINLRQLLVSDNRITNLNLTTNTALEALNLANNLLTSLDISNNTSLSAYGTYGGLASGLALGGMPQLQEVCVWDDFTPDTGYAQELPDGVTLVDTTGSPNICFETQCNGICEVPQFESYTRSFSFQGVNRKYEVIIPDTFEENMPLVIALHGWSGTIELMKDYTGLHQFANGAGFVLAIPAGISNSWNIGLTWCPDRGDFPGVDDVGFISAMIDSLYFKHNIDLSRVYVCGWSTGGQMALRLGAEIGDRLAAVATVGGGLFDQAENWDLKRSMPVLSIHGTEDLYYKYGGPGPTQCSEEWSLEQTLSYWVDHNQCDAEGDTTEIFNMITDDLSTAQKIVFDGSSDGAQVVHFKIIGGGHSWPDSPGPYPYWPTEGNRNRDINANQEIWNFFKAYDHPGAPLLLVNFADAQLPPFIYPNPTTSVLNIDVVDMAGYSIYNLSGKLLIKDNRPGINISHLPEGTYILKVHLKNGEVQTGKVVRK